MLQTLQLIVICSVIKIFLSYDPEKKLEETIGIWRNNFLKTVGEKPFEIYAMGYEECSPIAKKIKNQNSSQEIIQLVEESGIFESENGKESKCIEKNGVFVFFTYNFNSSSEKMNIDEQFVNFIEDNSFFISACLPQGCEEFYTFALNTQHNTVLNDSLSELGIENFSPYKIVSPRVEEGELSKDNFNYKLYSYVFYGLIIYLVIRLTCTIIYHIVSNKTDDNEDDDDDENENNNNLLDDSYDSDDEDIKKKTKRKIKKKIKKKKEKFTGNSIYYQPKLPTSLPIKILKRFSYVDSFFKLGEKVNNIYNENNIVTIGGLRLISLFFITVCENFFFMAQYSRNSAMLLSIIADFSISSIKLASFFYESIKILNGTMFGFKIMSYVNSHPRSVKSYILFYLKFLVYFISFVVIHFCVQFLFREIGYSMTETTQYQYISKIIFNKCECLYNPLTIFYPFYLQYFTDKACPKNILFSLSEFYCFTFISILFFVLISVKKRFLDYLFLGIGNVLLLANYFFVEKIPNQTDFKLKHFLGNRESFSSPLVFLSVYLIGFNIGVMFYYYKNLEVADTEKEKKCYFPLYYNFVIMKFVSQKSQIFKNLIMFLSAIGIFLVSCDFHFLMNFYSSPNIFTFKANYIVNLIYCYENQVFSLIFSIFTLNVLLSSNDSVIKTLFSATVLVPINRISFVFFNLSNILIIIGFCTMNIDSPLNKKSTYESCYSIFAFGMFISYLFVVLIETPVKSVFKTITKKKSNYSSVRESFI